MAIRIVRTERKEKYIDHADLINREIADQHPITAITGLQDYLDSVYNEINTLGDTITSRIVIGGTTNYPVEIPETAWLFSDEQKAYYFIMAHTFKSEDVTVNFMNELKHNIDVEIDYEILNDSSIAVYIESPKYVKAIINGYLNINLAGLKAVKTADFLDDSVVTMNKGWSSYQIVKYLGNYVAKADTYTKLQMEEKFASKAKEHGHENIEVINGFKLNEKGDLLYNDKQVIRNVEPVAKTLTWANQTNEILNLILDTANVYADIKGIFISNSEFIIRNENTDNLIMKVTDGELDILNVEIKPNETQKYLLGTSPNVKIYVKGIFSAQFTVEAISEIDNIVMTSPIINNSVVSDNTAWGSKKTQQEISKATSDITLQTLGDVVMSEKRDNMVLAYSALTDKFVAVDSSTLSIQVSGTDNMLKQINVTNSQGTVDRPLTVEIPINSTDFKFNKVNVLKFNPKVDNSIKTVNNFSIIDKNDFISPDYVVIDNGIKFDTDSEYTPTNKSISTDSNSVISVYDLDLTNYKSVEDIVFNYELSSATSNIKISCIPNDTLLVQQKDINLSFVENIDYFKLVGSGKNIRVVASPDSGANWKTFNGAWVDVELTVDSVKVNGMSLDTFNSVVNATAWNELLNNSVRFAYLISQDDLTDLENIVELQVQYDTFGSWVQAKDTEYDVLYISNTILKVLLYISGDMKINF